MEPITHAQHVQYIARNLEGQTYDNYLRLLNYRRSSSGHVPSKMLRSYTHQTCTTTDHKSCITTPQQLCLAMTL